MGCSGSDAAPYLPLMYARTSATASSERRVLSVRMYVMTPTRPSSPISTPSYRRWARPMVRLGEKRSLLDASCCSLEVMKGGGAFLRRSLRSIVATRGELFLLV